MEAEAAYSRIRTGAWYCRQYLTELVYPNFVFCVYFNWLYYFSYCYMHFILIFIIFMFFVSIRQYFSFHIGTVWVCLVLFYFIIWWSLHSLVFSLATCWDEWCHPCYTSLLFPSHLDTECLCPFLMYVLALFIPRGLGTSIDRVGKNIQILRVASGDCLFTFVTRNSCLLW